MRSPAHESYVLYTGTLVRILSQYPAQSSSSVFSTCGVLLLPPLRVHTHLLYCSKICLSNGITSCISHPGIMTYTHRPASGLTTRPASAPGSPLRHWLLLPALSAAGSPSFGPPFLQSPLCIPSFWPRSRAMAYSRYGFFFCHMTIPSFYSTF